MVHCKFDDLAGRYRVETLCRDMFFMEEIAPSTYKMIMNIMKKIEPKFEHRQRKTIEMLADLEKRETRCTEHILADRKSEYEVSVSRWENEFMQRQLSSDYQSTRTTISDTRHVASDPWPRDRLAEHRWTRSIGESARGSERSAVTLRSHDDLHAIPMSHQCNQFKRRSFHGTCVSTVQRRSILFFLR